MQKNLSLKISKFKNATFRTILLPLSKTKGLNYATWMLIPINPQKDLLIL